MNDTMLANKIDYGYDRLGGAPDQPLTEHSHILMGQRAAAALGHQEGSAEHTRLVDAYSSIWHDLHASQVPAGHDGISKDQFRTSTLTLAADPAKASATLGNLARTYFDIADTDGNEVIDADEYLTFLRSTFPDITAEDAKTAFDHLDLDGDGTLSREEFNSACIEYWSSNDPQAPGNWWLGVPVDER